MLLENIVRRFALVIYFLNGLFRNDFTGLAAILYGSAWRSRNTWWIGFCRTFAESQQDSYLCRAADQGDDSPDTSPACPDRLIHRSDPPPKVECHRHRDVHLCHYGVGIGHGDGSSCISEDQASE